MEMPNRKQNRLTEFDYEQEGAYFVTLCTQNRARLFQMELPGVGNDLCVIPGIFHKYVFRNGTQAVPYSKMGIFLGLSHPFETTPFSF